MVRKRTNEDDRRFYPLLAVYGAIGRWKAHAASFTTLQCIAMVTLGEENALLTSENLTFLLK